MIVANELGSRMAEAVRLMIVQERWSPDLEAVRALFDLERFLSIRIQAGQPDLEAMNASLICAAATDLIAVVTSALAAGEIDDVTMEEADLLSSASLEADRLPEEPLPLAA